MATASINDQFAREGGRLPGGDEVAALRRSALDRFQELKLPGRSLETWHYTDLGELGKRELEFVAQEPGDDVLQAAESELKSLPIDPDALQCVFVDGSLIDAWSTLPAGGDCTFDTLTDEPERLLGTATPIQSSLVALNTAFASAGISLSVTGQLTRPVHLVFIGSGRDVASQLRLKLKFEQKAAATVVQTFVDLADSDGWLNLVCDVVLDGGSRLDLYRLQRNAPSRFHTSLTRASVASGASFASSSVELGGRLVRNELQIALQGKGARADVLGLALTREQRHCDTRIAVDHRAPETVSRQDYRAIAADRSRSVFNGKVTVAEDAQHIDARQRNDNLLLSPHAEIDTKPELEIYADQVVCSHGATVGELDEDHLFYLRSRGIDEAGARAILTSAFADVILARIELEEIRDLARSAVAETLPPPIAAEDASA